MKSITLKTPAKINLGLSILRKLPSDYHEVKTIYSQISLFDILQIKEIDGDKIEIDCSDRNIPTDKRNLVYQAADLMKKQIRVKKGVRIFIKKRTPVGSGLGGGSSNAAATFKALNKLWQLNLPLVQLIKLAQEIGSDVAYQLVGGVQLEIQGGEKAGEFTSLGKLPNGVILVSIPDIVIGSKQAYSRVQYDEIGKNNLVSLIKALQGGSLKKIAKNLHNDFEIWTLRKYPVIQKIKQLMIKYGALGSLMSGKGSAVFGLFDKKGTAQKAFGLIKKDYPRTFLVKPYYREKIEL